MNKHYPGINPHLNSHLQSPGGGWESFHAVYLQKLEDALEAALPDNYYAISEKSLQITHIDPPSTATRRTKPDTIVIKTDDQQHSDPSSTAVSTPTITLPVTDGFDEEDDLMGVVIYRFELGDLPGEPITRIELLSPGNKPGGAHYPQYIHSRRVTLQAGLRLIEIDWLHETRPVIPTIPVYRMHDDAYPYHVIVNDPRPSLSKGQTHVYGFRVCDVIPIINLPLNTRDTVTVDFGHIYHQTVNNRRAFQLMTDYTTEPARFNTYDATDQHCIHTTMATIRDAYN